MKLKQNGKGVTLSSYELIPVDEQVAEDGEIAALVEDYKAAVEADYLSRYGLTFDQVLGRYHPALMEQETTQFPL